MLSANIQLLLTKEHSQLMKASVSYNDFIGTSAADIADHISAHHGDTLKSIAQHLGLNQDRFELIGISVNGVDDFSVSLLCVDKQQQKDGRDLIVSMMFDGDKERVKLDSLFKRLEIVLHEKHDDVYLPLDSDNEVRFSDFHETEEE